MESATESIQESLPLSRSISTDQTHLPKVPWTTKSNPVIPAPTFPSQSLTFIKMKGCYIPAKQFKLRNSLLAGVGFLELANAGDFAANVWNQIPVPRYAIALMAIGGTVALGISTYAFKDALLSWRNVVNLREERHHLQTQKITGSPNGQMVRCLNSLLDVNFREKGTELVDRVSMDLFMGFGAIAVGVGTLIAIDGADRRVWHASNLLSGYIGNAPCALYGIANLAWSAYVWRRALRHKASGANELKGTDVGEMLKRRTDTVKFHAMLNGITGVIAGAASLVTATMWWGYLVLAPCIVISILCNYLWRHRIGYDRPFVRQSFSMDETSLVKELQFVHSTQRIFEENPSDSLSKLVSDPGSITSVIDFITKNDLFEDLCVRVLKDAKLSATLFVPLNETIIIDPQSLLAADDRSISSLLGIARTCVREVGPMRFKYRERYLIEALGCYLCNSEVENTTEKAGEDSSQGE